MWYFVLNRPTDRADLQGHVAAERAGQRWPHVQVVQRQGVWRFAAVSVPSFGLFVHTHRRRPLAAKGAGPVSFRRGADVLHFLHRRHLRTQPDQCRQVRAAQLSAICRGLPCYGHDCPLRSVCRFCLMSSPALLICYFVAAHFELPWCAARSTR